MSNVTIEINGRPYTMACGPGEEDQLELIARTLDREVARVKASVGDVGELRLLVMAGLMLCDRAAAADVRVAEMQADLARLAQDDAEVSAHEARAASLLARAAARLEEIAEA